MTQHDDTLILIAGYGQMTYKQAKNKLDTITDYLQRHPTNYDAWSVGKATALAVKNFEDKIQ